jgi:putative CocE/NonD family hydrolase
VDVYPPQPDYPAGFALNLTDTIVRMRYRNGRHVPEPIQPNEVYRIRLELPSVANTFGAGHRIRLDISSSSAPQFDVNPNTGDSGRSFGSMIARNTLYHDSFRASRLMLSVRER